MITSHEATIRYDEIVEHVTPRSIISYFNAHSTYTRVDLEYFVR